MADKPGCRLISAHMIEAHMASRADVNVWLTRRNLFPLTSSNTVTSEKASTIPWPLTTARVTKMYMNSSEPGMQNISMNNIYIIDRELLISQINTAYVRGQVYFERDILAPQLERLNVQAFRYDGYVARISSMKSYFNENMKMLDDVNVDALFSAGNPIYTKIRDDNPARYINGSKVSNITCKRLHHRGGGNSILFVASGGKGAWVKNCVLMQDTVIEADAGVEYVVTDKNATITRGKIIKGTVTFPVYVAKYQIV